MKSVESYTYDGVLQYEEYSRGLDVGVTLYANDSEIVYIRGQKLNYNNFESLQKAKTCYKDVIHLAGLGGKSVCDTVKGTSCLLPRVFMITDVELESYDDQGVKLRGLGLGKILYEVIFTEFFEENGDFIAVPMKCIFGRDNTSPDAQRVWDSLARNLESSSDLVLVDRALHF
jgi:hypothetical protein